MSCAFPRTRYCGHYCEVLSLDWYCFYAAVSCNDLRHFPPPQLVSWQANSHSLYKFAVGQSSGKVLIVEQLVSSFSSSLSLSLSLFLLLSLSLFLLSLSPSISLSLFSSAVVGQNSHISRTVSTHCVSHVTRSCDCHMTSTHTDPRSGRPCICVCWNPTETQQVHTYISLACLYLPSEKFT